jgi:hypothetical protein
MDIEIAWTMKLSEVNLSFQLGTSASFDFTFKQNSVDKLCSEFEFSRRKTHFNF